MTKLPFRPGEAIVCQPLEITVRPGESAERMIKRFTKTVRNDGVLQEFHLRRSFEKESVARRRKSARAAHLRMIAIREK